jgi:Gpi18-like mannosyltransferase
MFGLVAGVILRVLVVTSPGTPDVHTWKSWSHAASTEPLGLYGVGGTPPERRLLVWGEIKGTTEYPPVALYELAAAGRVYRAIDPDFADSPWLTVLVKAPGLLAECLFVCALLVVGPRLLGQQPAQWMALALWLNPAVILNGAALGYLDTQMALPAAAALIALIIGRPVWAGVFIAVAVFTKPQALFVGPALLLALSRQTRVAIVPALTRFGAAGLLTTAAILLPILLNGAWSNMVQAVSRVASHDMLSGYAMNVWWLDHQTRTGPGHR